MSRTGSRRFGLRVRDLTGENPATAADAVERIAALGAGGIQFPSLGWIAPDLDRSPLRAAVRHAEQHDLRPSAVLGVLNPVFPGRSDEIAGPGEGDVLAGARALIAAAADAGIGTLHFTVGRLEDRFLRSPDYAEQCARTAETLGVLAPAAEDAGVTLVLKTHEEMSSHEAVALVEAVSSPALRLGFSPVNLLVLGEDPVAAAHRVRAVTHSVFLDDAVMTPCDAGLRRVMVPLGWGDVAWPEILEVLGEGELALDIHRAEFECEFLTDDWLRFNPHVTVMELTRLLSRARHEDAVPAFGADARFSLGVDALTGA